MPAQTWKIWKRHQKKSERTTVSELKPYIGLDLKQNKITNLHIKQKKLDMMNHREQNMKLVNIIIWETSSRQHIQSAKIRKMSQEYEKNAIKEMNENYQIW